MLSKQLIGDIIMEITPYYNRYKKEKDVLSGAEAIEIKWEIGDILKKYIDQYCIDPHTLYREIYGKGGSEHNAVQRSYITREDQGRCYRIRNMFLDKSVIRKTFPNLVSFTAFRECMPFFDNPKYKFEGKKMDDLLALLNSNKKPSFVLKEIKKLKDQYIGIKNPRTQKLGEMKDGLKSQFVDVFNDMKNLFNLNYEELTRKLEDYNLTQKDLLTLSLNIKAFTNDSYEMTIIDDSNIKSNEWKCLISSINTIIAKKNYEERRRVQRVIAPNVLALISDMVVALSSEEYFDNYKKNHR